MKHRRRRRSDPPMRGGDRVAPHFPRRYAYPLVALGVAGVVVSTILAVSAVNQNSVEAATKATLSQDEVAQIRGYLAEARTRRDAEKAAVQAQLDQQTTALCAALGEVARDASANGRAALARAGKAIGCPSLPRPTLTTRPKASGSTTTTSGDDPDVTSPAPGAAKPPTGTPAGSTPKPRPGTKPAPQPTPPPTPAPTKQPGLLDPVTDPICQTLFVCL